MLLNDDQIQLRDLIRAVLTDKLTPEYRVGRSRNPSEVDSSLSALLDDIGLFDAFGGDTPSCTRSDLAVVSHECGRVLFPELLIEPLLLAQCAATATNEDDRKVLSSVGRYGGVATPRSCNGIVFSDTDDRCTASGVVPFVHLRDDSAAVVVWEVDWSREKGIQAYVLPILQPNVEVASVPSLDLMASAKQLTLTGAQVMPLSALLSADLHAGYCVAVASEAAGLCEYVLELTTEYVKTREQFGVPIGGFQAIQQVLAAAYVDSESLRALASFASWCLSHSPEQVELTSLAAVVRAAAVAPTVCERSIQCHGGIGFTWEYELHLYLRRARAIATLWGIDDDSASAILAVAAAAG